ncbi:hypothetical protein RI054_03g14120 [Pseudoscourfieldia marina]
MAPPPPSPPSRCLTRSAWLNMYGPVVLPVVFLLSLVYSFLLNSLCLLGSLLVSLVGVGWRKCVNFSFTSASRQSSPQVVGWCAALHYIWVVKEICADSAADVEYTNEDGFTALIWACLNGHIDVVRYLVDEKNAAVNMPPNRHTPLRGAGNYGHLEVVQFLLNRGADPNVPSMGGRTPIMGAAMNGYMDVLEALLEHGADKSAKNDGGETALDLAKLKGHDAVVARLEH